MNKLTFSHDYNKLISKVLKKYYLTTKFNHRRLKEFQLVCDILKGDY
jgi:hypothetical protein